MPSWLIAMMLNLGAGLINRYGIPFVEKTWPHLVPLLEEFLKVIKGAKPSEELSKASDHYSHLCSGVACPPDLKKL